MNQNRTAFCVTQNKPRRCVADCPNRSETCHTKEFNCPYYRADCEDRRHEKELAKNVLRPYAMEAKQRAKKRAKQFSAGKSDRDF